MFSTGDIIDEKYKVRDLCSNLGGMGTILHVEPLAGTLPDPIVLKYCKADDDRSKKRFRREVRYLIGFAGNSKVLQVTDCNLNIDPPYFVMKYYIDGDLSGLIDRFQSDIAFQEDTFNKMLYCVSELHAKGLYHRDIKPENFLVEGENIIISDLGLAKEVGAGTTFTMSREYGGTLGYIPPEFYTGGFKAATPPSDIFMLGKTFYHLLTKRDPLYMTNHDIHPALYHVIEKCCNLEPESRYPTIDKLLQDLKLAYNVIQGRGKGIGTSRQMLSHILSHLNTEQQYDVKEVNDFLDLLAMLPDDERSDMFHELPEEFFSILAQKPFEPKLSKFLEHYEDFTQDAVNTFSYAETVAMHMNIIFDQSGNPGHRARALEIAINGAIWANRYAAMETCKNMITSVIDNDLGDAVAVVISKNRGTFIDGIETSHCKNNAIKNALRANLDSTS